MKVQESEQNGTAPVPPPPPPALPASPAKAVPCVPSKQGGGSPSTGLLLKEIRNGITLKPTKTVDKSTAAFIKKSNGVHTPSPASPLLPTRNGDSPSPDLIKDAFKEELQNTIKRKVKKQSVEQGDGTKNETIEKAIEPARTEVQLKLNKFTQNSPTCQAKFDKVPAKFNTLPRSPAIQQQLKNGSTMERPPPKPARTFENSIAPTTEGAPKVEIKPFDSSSVSLYGTLRKAKQVRNDTSIVGHSDDKLKNAILSPEVKHGTASIRPSQIKTLTRQGSRVTPADIVENEKQIAKGPVSLIEAPPAIYSLPPPKDTARAASEPAPSRTTILDTKLRSPIPSRTDANNPPPQKLLISHPRANFTIGRSGRKVETSNFQTESRPVFRILNDLERVEQQARESENEFIRFKQRQPSPMKISTKTKEPSTMGSTTTGPAAAAPSYMSFSKELGNATNNHPDAVVKITTIATRKEDVFFENTNLRDIKIDIVENGQPRVVKK